MERTQVLSSIRNVARSFGRDKVDVRLFGSQARNEAKDGSDWDILVLVDKSKLDETDHERYAYPFWVLGWQTGAMIHPVIYTLSDWNQRKGTPFYDNVETDGIPLC